MGIAFITEFGGFISVAKNTRDFSRGMNSR